MSVLHSTLITLKQPRKPIEKILKTFVNGTKIALRRMQLNYLLYGHSGKSYWVGQLAK